MPEAIAQDVEIIHFHPDFFVVHEYPIIKHRGIITMCSIV
jgi:hypothetical protein